MGAFWAPMATAGGFELGLEGILKPMGAFSEVWREELGFSRACKETKLGPKEAKGDPKGTKGGHKGPQRNPNGTQSYMILGRTNYMILGSDAAPEHALIPWYIWIPTHCPGGGWLAVAGPARQGSKKMHCLFTRLPGSCGGVVVRAPRDRQLKKNTVWSTAVSR